MRSSCALEGFGCRAASRIAASTSAAASASARLSARRPSVKSLFTFLKGGLDTGIPIPPLDVGIGEFVRVWQVDPLEEPVPAPHETPAIPPKVNIGGTRGAAMRLCACGCGASIEHLRSQAKFVNHAHRMRALRSVQKPSQAGDLGSPPGEPVETVSAPSATPQVTAQMTTEQLSTRVEALGREFNRAGSTAAMRREAATLA